MKGENRSKSSLFLMEMIMVILFFSITSAICVGLFTKAHLTAQESVELTHAVLLSENAAEAFKASAGDIEKTAQILDGTMDADGALRVGYDRAWAMTAATPAYTLRVAASGTGDVVTADIVIAKQEKIIYQLTVKAYQEEAAVYA